MIEIPSKSRWADRAKYLLPGPKSLIRRMVIGTAVVGGVIALIILANLEENPANFPPSSVPVRPAFNAIPLALPMTGTVWRYFIGTATPSLTVKTQRGGGHHLIKIEEWTSGSVVAMLFIREGENGRVNVPPGTYRIKFASGSTWYGDQLRFGPNETDDMADNQFEFSHYLQGDEFIWTDETIMLYPHLNGNLRTSHISRGEF